MNKLFLLLLGLSLLIVGWLGPLSHSAHHSFTAHMTLHMLIVALATPLIAIGLAGTKYDLVIPQPSCFPPVLASMVEMILVWFWHAPYLHSLAAHTSWGFAAEQASFALAGWWLWQAAFGGDGNELQRSERRSAGVLALLLTSMHMTLLGALISLSPRVLFRHGHGDGFEHAMADQQLGGAIMLVVGGMAYLLGGLVLISQVVYQPRER